MVFSSLEFLFLFLPIFLIIYYIVPFKLKNLILIIFSLIFYSFGEPIYISLLIISSLVDFSNGYFINKYQNDKRKKKIFLVCSIVINLSFLVIFKYLNFFIDNINSFGFNISNPNLSLPLGISFFTFQTMSYSIDVYSGRIKYEKNFINFMAYVTMFPQLVAGPIVRYSDISKELECRNITFEKYSDGLFRFLTGLFKKVLFANVFGSVFSIITSGSSYSLLSSYLGALSFGLQIYFDFSGYSDMAIGLGKMLGFNYPQNFNYPYIANSITDFWRRWHITLSTFFRDYVYIPLGGNRVSNKRWLFNLFVVWFLTGFWHGASWNFIIWGLYFFAFILFEKKVLFKIKIPKFLSHIYVIFVLLVGWIIFAFDNTSTLLTYLKGMFINKVIIDNTFMFCIRNYFLYFVLGIILSTPIVHKVKKNIFINICVGIIYLILFILTIASLVSDSYNPFLYFRF